MRLIKPSVEIWDQEEGLNGVYKSIERAGRICYKSSDKITKDSAEPFVDRMIKSLHHSMLEQGTVYLTIPREDINYHIYLSKYRDNPYSECRVAQTLEGIPVGSLYISTNYRVIIEHDWTDDLKYLCKPTKFHEKRISVHFTLDRAVSMEFLRHKKFSFAQESTRYCVSGDTLLRYKNPHNKYTIEELYRDKIGQNKLSKLKIEVLNLDTGKLEYSEINNIFYNGIKPIYKIITKLGYSLKCTGDHKIYTPNGWKELQNISSGDFIYVNGKDSVSNFLYRDKDWLYNQYVTLNKTVKDISIEFKYGEDILRKWLYKFKIYKPKDDEKPLYTNYDWLYNENIILNKTFVQISKETGYNVSTLKKWASKLNIPKKGTGYFNIGKTPWNKGLTEEDDHRIKKQANTLRKYHHNNGDSKTILKEDTSEYQKYKKSYCEICNTTEDLEVHHIDHNRTNNFPINLITVCSSCHQSIHSQNLKILHADEVLSIEYIGEEDVYDLEINHYHNYVANGIIVHNCNFSKNKFNNEITYIIPTWLDIPEGKITIKPHIGGDCIKSTPFIDDDSFISYHKEYGLDKQRGGYYINDFHLSDIDNSPISLFIRSLEFTEQVYLNLVSSNWTPQQARQVLPNALKTELVMTGFISDWKHFIDLRYRGTTGKPHPDAFYLAEKLYNLFKEKGIDI